MILSVYVPFIVASMVEWDWMVCGRLSHVCKVCWRTKRNKKVHEKFYLLSTFLIIFIIAKLLSIQRMKLSRSSGLKYQVSNNSSTYRAERPVKLWYRPLPATNASRDFFYHCSTVSCSTSGFTKRLQNSSNICGASVFLVASLNLMTTVFYF